MTEQEQFEEFLKPHLAALVAAAAKYTRRLSPEDRDWFFTTTLARAWHRRMAFNPKRQAITQWFEECLRFTAESRKTWYVLHVDGWRKVSGKGLGERI